MTFVQRAESSLRLNAHFHRLARLVRVCQRHGRELTELVVASRRGSRAATCSAGGKAGDSWRNPGGPALAIVGRERGRCPRPRFGPACVRAHPTIVRPSSISSRSSRDRRWVRRPALRAIKCRQRRASAATRARALAACVAQTKTEPESSGRQFNCGRCRALVVICRHCDRGNIYCGPRCASEARRESRRACNARHQRSARGRRLHAARQARYRAKAFSEWNQVFESAACLVTLIDRLCHRAEIVEIRGESYRVKESKARSKQRRNRRRG